MESQENHHHLPEDASLESRKVGDEQDAQVAPTPIALLERLRVGRSSRLVGMDESQLHTALESAEWQVRVAAVQTMEEWGERAPIDRFIKAVQDEHEAVRAAAVQALGALRNPGAVVPLVEALHDSVWFVRATAVQALGNLGEQIAVAPLKMALLDEDEAVRAAAVRALGTMGDHSTLEVILAALQDSAWQVREMALLTLGTWREPIPQAAIASALQDEDESVRRAAHFFQEMLPGSFAETMQPGEQMNAALPLVDEQAHQQATLPHSLQRYPRRGRLRVMRLVLLACWTIFLGYMVGVAWVLVQLTHANLGQVTDRLFIQVLLTPFNALTKLHVPDLLLGACIALVALLFFGCLWAARDVWFEHRWLSRRAVDSEEDEIETGGRDQLRGMPVHQFSQDRSPRRLSRRVLLAGLTTVLIAGNTIAWSLLLNSRRPRGNATLAPGSTLFTYRGHQNAVVSVAWSPDGKRIASGSDDNTLQVWDSTDGRHVFTDQGSVSVFWVAWSPDGTRIASESGTYPRRISSAVMNNNTIQILDAATGDHIHIYSIGQFTPGKTVDAVSLSPDEKLIAIANSETVQVLNAGTGRHLFTYSGHNDLVNLLTWSPDGTRIASVSVDTTVHVWDATTGDHAHIYRGHHSLAVNDVEWSPDSQRIALGGQDTTVEVWDATDGSHIYTYRGHSTEVKSVAWSPDGRRIASAGYDTTVQVWDAADGSHVLIYRGHATDLYNFVNTVAWSPDGTRIASGSTDTTVQVWLAE
jgi:WD40 repeat protein